MVGHMAHTNDAYEPDVDDDDDELVSPVIPRMRANAVRRASNRPRGVATPQRIAALEKERRALEFRKAGMTYAEIANQVGYADASGARKAVIRGMQSIIQEPAVELRTWQYERLNHMLLVLWPKVQQGKERAIETSLRIMDKMDRLFGTEAAKEVDVNVHHQGAVLVIDGDKDSYIAAVKRMAGYIDVESEVSPAAVGEIGAGTVDLSGTTLGSSGQADKAEQPNGANLVGDRRLASKGRTLLGPREVLGNSQVSEPTGLTAPVAEAVPAPPKIDLSVEPGDDDDDK